MANFLCEINGCGGQSLHLYDTKLVFRHTTRNQLSNEKTIFLCDVTGIQYRDCGNSVGQLQFDTNPSPRPDGDSNTFTFQLGRNGTGSQLINALYRYVCDRVEEIKTGKSPVQGAPDFASLKIPIVPEDATSPRRCICGGMIIGGYCISCHRRAWPHNPDPRQRLYGCPTAAALEGALDLHSCNVEILPL